MEPLGTPLAGKTGCPLNELCSDAPALKIGMEAGVEEKGVLATIGGNVDVTDQPIAGMGGNVAKAAGEDVLVFAIAFTAPDGAHKGGKGCIIGKGVVAKIDLFGHSVTLAGRAKLANLPTIVN